MFYLEDCIAFITSRSAKIFAETLEQDLKPYNVTRAQWTAMHYIDSNQSITQRELADKMCIKEPTVVRMLQKMEAAGYLCRYGSNIDKRVKQLKLTDKGLQIYRKLLPVVEEFKNDTISGISPQDLQIMKQAMQSMVENALKRQEKTIL